MWLTSSSVGRKFIMALTGCALVLFVTFHCVMNSVAILWPTAYNLVCEFLGANWYALAGTAGLALLIVVHIIYACWLTVQNRRARGKDRYLITSRPKTVEWSSKNMLVLGFVILAFMGIHLWQFWTKMQLAEVCGQEAPFPAAAGTLYLSLAFGQVWTICVYVVAFVALWFHLTHGFWSMFQSVGWDSTRWIPRLKCIGWWWASIVCVLFIAEAGVFTWRAMDGYYYSNPALQDQYVEMIGGTLNEYAEYQDKEAAVDYTAYDFNGLIDQVNSDLEGKIDPKGELCLKDVPEENQIFYRKLFEARAQLQNIAGGAGVDEETQASADQAPANSEQSVETDADGSSVEIVEDQYDYTDGGTKAVSVKINNTNE